VAFQLHVAITTSNYDDDEDLNGKTRQIATLYRCLTHLANDYAQQDKSLSLLIKYFDDFIDLGDFCEDPALI
jgi:hypothetical protein